MGLGELRVVPTCCCAFFCFWIIFAIVGLSVSISSLEQGRYALKLDWTTQQIDPEVIAEPGMKNLGFGNMLLEYPSVYQNMYFLNNHQSTCQDEDPADCEDVVRSPVYARSQDGLEMRISVSFQWKLEPQVLIPLYSILGNDLYKDEFVRFARASIVESCTFFTADMFFSNRTIITADMLDRLRENFNQPERNLKVEITGLQLREVDLPDDFDEEIGNTQEQIQEVEVARAEREEQMITMEREIIVATEHVQEVLEDARGQAQAIMQANNATVSQMLNLQRRQAESNALVLQMFANDTDPFGRLFSMMKIRALESHTDSALLISM